MTASEISGPAVSRDDVAAFARSDRPAGERGKAATRVAQRMSRIELHRLRYFVVLAQELHFRVAAAKLHIAQPPLTKQIKRLEEDIGVALFLRTKRHVELTPAGQRFLTEAKKILTQVDNAAEAARWTARG
jgi:DNA-binding MarR family transcriptional regulator